MAIEIFNEDISLPEFDYELIKDFVSFIIHQHQAEVGEISYIFCSDDYLLKVNIEYLQHDYYTDVITFDYVEGDIISGDVFISVDRIEDNANTYNVSFEQEFVRVVSHGILHLLGFKDKTDEEAAEMRKQENWALEQYHKIKGM